MGITRPRSRFPSTALILSCLALFAALGGSTYAATATSSSALHFTNATLKNGWKSGAIAQHSNYAPAGYAKDSLGVVHLRGVIVGGSSNTVAFVLPKALRPKHLIFPVIVGDGPSVAFLTVQPNGAVRPNGTAVSGFTGLDGVSFAAGE